MITGGTKMRAGDAVFHRPTGETWVVAAVDDDGWFFAAGWPETRARQEDTEIKRTVTDAEHREFLEQVAQGHAENGGWSARAFCAKRNLDALGKP